MKKLKKTLSRIKYDRSHPTVSARIPSETKAKLLVELKRRGMSLPDALKVLAGELEVKGVSIEEVRKAGYEEAKNIYMVSYSCSGCGKPIPIISPKAKAAVGKYMTEHGWAHAECHKRRRQL